MIPEEHRATIMDSMGPGVSGFRRITPSVAIEFALAGKSLGATEDKHSWFRNVLEVVRSRVFRENDVL